MSDAKSNDQVYSLKEWEDGRGVSVEITAKYLNYDISDGLKARLRETVQEKLDRGVRYFVMDLTKVSIVDSCGVGLMIGIHNLVQEKEGVLYLTGITRFLEKIFRMMHLDQYFNVVSTEEEVRELVAATA